MDKVIYWAVHATEVQLSVVLGAGMIGVVILLYLMLPKGRWMRYSQR